MSKYTSRYIHKISPSDKDVGPVLDLTAKDLENDKTFAAALRKAKVLSKGERVRGLREEPRGSGRYVAFPVASVWHSVIVTPKP